MRILDEYESLGKAGKGALLRREGLYASLISAWRQQRDSGARAGLARPAGRPLADARDKELARLRARVERLESELGKVPRGFFNNPNWYGENSRAIAEPRP